MAEKKVANPDEVAVDEAEAHPNDPKVREDRKRAEEYAARVSAGEEPWNDPELSTSLFALNDDVGETGEADEVPEPVSDDIATAKAKDDTEAPADTE